MKRFFSTILLVCLAQTSIFAADVIVPQNTAVNLKVKRLATSKNISSTYEIKAEVADDVFVNNVRIAHFGNDAILCVENFTKARGFGKSGSIVIKGARFYDDNNESHKLDVKKEVYVNDDGFFARLIPFNKGQQAMILPSEVLIAHTISSFTYKQNSTINKQKQAQQKQNSIQNKTTVQVGIINRND